MDRSSRPIPVIISITPVNSTKLNTEHPVLVETLNCNRNCSNKRTLDDDLQFCMYAQNYVCPKLLLLLAHTCNVKL